eukprot:GHVN01074312.1.p1 GENE.GHVN01074312.1~~GHVN01074312.1.p1  ORF type:complete len:243 (-),score=37.22 GHVN01074312.1:1453-2181(-)
MGEVSCRKMSLVFPFMTQIASKSDPNIEYSYIMINDEIVKALKFDTASGRYLMTDLETDSTLAPNGEVKLYSNDASLDFKIELPSEAYAMSFAEKTWPITKEMRGAWLDRYTDETARSLNEEVPNLNVVEVDNTVRSCESFEPSAKKQLKVVEFNAEGGTNWLLSVIKMTSNPKFMDADVIILNEMDIGMAESRNEHTTRLMAFALNYAWGLEFVELTNGLGFFAVWTRQYLLEFKNFVKYL